MPTPSKKDRDRREAREYSKRREEKDGKGGKKEAKEKKKGRDKDRGSSKKGKDTRGRRDTEDIPPRSAKDEKRGGKERGRDRDSRSTRVGRDARSESSRSRGASPAHSPARGQPDPRTTNDRLTPMARATHDQSFPLFSPTHRVSAVSHLQSPRHSVLTTTAFGAAAPPTVVVRDDDLLDRQPGMLKGDPQQKNGLAHAMPPKPGAADFVGQFVQSALTGDFRQVSQFEPQKHDEVQTAKRIVDKARRCAAEFRSVVISLTWAFSQLRVAMIAAFLFILLLLDRETDEFVYVYGGIANVVQKTLNLIAFLTFAISLCLLAVVNHDLSHYFLEESRKNKEEREYGDLQQYFVCFIPNMSIYYYHLLLVLIYLAILALCLVTAQYDDVLIEHRMCLPQWTAPVDPNETVVPVETVFFCNPGLIDADDHPAKIRDRTDLFHNASLARFFLSVIGWFVGLVFNFYMYEDDAYLEEDLLQTVPVIDDRPAAKHPPRAQAARTPPAKAPAQPDAVGGHAGVGRVRMSWQQPV